MARLRKWRNENEAQQNARHDESPPPRTRSAFSQEWESLTPEERAERARRAMAGMFGPPEEAKPKKPPDDDDDINEFLKF